MIIPIAEWKPDLAPEQGGQRAENVIADVGSYLPWPSLENYSNSISARCQGAWAAKDKSGINYNYAADGANIYILGDQTWAKASISASFTTASTEWWEAVQWGETVIFTNYQNDVSEITLGATQVNDLAGVPPKAKHIAIVRDFVVLGNILDSPQRVQWCAINNTHSWTVDATTQADYQDLVGEGGHVQKVVGGNSMIVFQERAIWRGQYVGSPIIFDFGNGPVEKTLGAYAPQSVADYGGMIFFLSEEGFRVFNGSSSQPIGYGKVDRTFFMDLDVSNVHRVQGIIDPQNKLYICIYPGSGNDGGNPNKLMVYNFLVQKWTIVSQEVELLFRHISTGYTLEGLDTVSTNIDTLPAGLDSSLWAGGEINLAAFTTGHRTALFTGSALSATVDTKESQHTPGQRTNVVRVRPLVDALTAAVAVGARNIMSESVTFGVPVTQGTTGDCPVRKNARYLSYRISTSGDFDHIKGVEILEASPAGNR